MPFSSSDNIRRYHSTSQMSKFDSDASSLDETLANLTLILKQKQQTLEEREHEINRKAAALESAKSQLFGDKSPSDVLHLNVGGTCIAVLRRTLTSVEGSMLASRFSGRWDDSLERDKNGNLFIDQPINLFEPMINYLRAKANETPLGPPVKSPHLKEYEARMNFYRMVEFYGMSLGIYPCNIELYRGDVGCADISDYPDCSVTARDWSTFTLQTQGHEREIISFEVVLGNVERMQIGWINESKYVENLSNDKNNGVGEELNSLALDCCRGGFLNQGEFIKLEGLSIGSGSVIRCEQKGCRWFCDGRLVISSIASDDATHFVNTFHPPGQVNGKDDKIIPSFSGKGHWRLGQIVLSNP
eukprot:g12475.t1 g12475   contig6:1989454-1990695(+)